MRENRFGNSFLVEDNSEVYRGVDGFVRFVNKCFVSVVDSVDEIVDGFVSDSSFIIIKFVGDKSIEVERFFVELGLLVEFFDVIVVVFYNFVDWGVICIGMIGEFERECDRFVKGSGVFDYVDKDFVFVCEFNFNYILVLVVMWLFFYYNDCFGGIVGIIDFNE